MKFRGGSKLSSHGNTVEEMVRHIVAKIRKSYRGEVPILVRMDAGFFDEKLFKVFEELGLGHFCTASFQISFSLSLCMADG